MSFVHLFPNVCGQQMTKGGQKIFFHLKRKKADGRCLGFRDKEVQGTCLGMRDKEVKGYMSRNA